MENILGRHSTTFFTLLGCQVSPKGKNSRNFDQKFYFGLRFFQIGDFSDYMEYGKIRPKGCLNICKGSHYWTNFLLLLVLKDGVHQSGMSQYECFISKSHFCITFDFEDESYICYAFWVPYEVYIKDFSKFHHFTLVLSSWWFSIHLLELKIQMWRIPPCHTSKVASWHVDYWYELHLWSSLSKIWLKVSKSGKNGQYCR